MAQSVCSFQPTVAIILWVKPSDSVIRTWYHVIQHVCHFSSWLVLYLFKFSLLHTPWTTYSIIVKTHFMVTSPCLISGMMSHVFFGLCGMWLCATNLHMTHMYCNGIHCHFCWLHVPHDMHDSHLPRQCWWAWWINHLFTSWVMKFFFLGWTWFRWKTRDWLYKRSFAVSLSAVTFWNHIIYIKIKCQHSVWWQPTVLWYQSGASHLSC